MIQHKWSTTTIWAKYYVIYRHCEVKTMDSRWVCSVQSACWRTRSAINPFEMNDPHLNRFKREHMTPNKRTRHHSSNLVLNAPTKTYLQRKIELAQIFVALSFVSHVRVFIVGSSTSPVWSSNISAKGSLHFASSSMISAWFMPLWTVSNWKVWHELPKRVKDIQKLSDHL